MKVSVIIPIYNESDVIQTCLRSLEKQSLKDFEVIVVNDGGRDKTDLSQLNENRLLVLTIEQPHQGAGAARNLGAKSARGDILVFVDADMTFDKNFLKMLTKPIISGKSKGTNSVDEYVSNWNNVWARCWNVNEGWENKKRHPKRYSNKQKVFRTILKSEFVKVGGFTPGGYNDDWSLSKKLGYEADLAPKAIFFHKNPGNLKEIFIHAQWVGKRKYKMGLVGYLLALLRSSLPLSLILGVFYGIRYLQPAFLVFKPVYDFGIFIGILKYMFTKQGAK